MKIFLTYLKISGLSIFISIYLFQIFLTIKYSGSLGEISKKISSYENNSGKKYDRRTKYEVYNELKKTNDDITVIIPYFRVSGMDLITQTLSGIVM